MTSNRWEAAIILCLACVGGGCSNRPNGPADVARRRDVAEHPKYGPHGGQLLEWGNREYFAEIVAQPEKSRVLVYLLDASGRKAAAVDRTAISNVVLNLTDRQPPVAFTCRFDASISGAEGLAFVVSDSAFASSESLRGNLSAAISGRSYSADFDLTASMSDHHGNSGDSHAAHAASPAAHEGGVHVRFAGGQYHAEALLHSGGMLHLFLLCSDMSRVIEADPEPIEAYVRETGKVEFLPLKFEPQRFAGDSDRKTARFVAALPKELVGKPIDVSVPGLGVNGVRYHFAFSIPLAQPGNQLHDRGEHASTSMPAPAPSARAKKLYLEPGGIYTTADIAANGGVTAGEKFRDFVANHDIKPMPGDKLCPVTLTKANPECHWIVNGTKYEFCCPPCVDEFVRWAKESPVQVKPPADYLMK